MGGIFGKAWCVMDRIRLYGIVAVLLVAAGAFVPFALYAGDEAVAGVMLGDTSLAGKNRREIAALLQERNREIRTEHSFFSMMPFTRSYPCSSWRCKSMWMPVSRRL